MRESRAGGRRSGHRLPARLFWRVYLNGLLLLALVALSVFAVGAALGRSGMPHNPRRFVEYTALRIGDLRTHPTELARELARIHDTFGAEVTVYQSGAALASNVDPPLPPLPPDDERRLLRGSLVVSHRHFTSAARVEGDPPAYVLLKGNIPSPSLVRGASFIGAVLLALALASIPLARAIAAPLERLGRAVRAFGSGDLSARAGLRDRGEVGEVAVAFDHMADRIQALLRTEKELL